MIKKLNYSILLILVILLPWHAFFITYISDIFLNSSSEFLPKTSLILASWKEVLIIILWWSFFYTWIKKKKFPIDKIYLFDKIFVAFFVVAMLSWIFLTKSFSEWLWWFRLDFIYFILFYLIRWLVFEKDKSTKLFFAFCTSSFISLFFWLWLYSYSFNYTPNQIDFETQRYLDLSEEKKSFLNNYYNEKWEIVSTNYELEEFFKHHEQINFRNENYLNLMKHFWYSKNISSYNPEKPLAAFHFVEARWTARFSWTFSWPNQAWFFLIILTSFIFSFLIKSKPFIHKVKEKAVNLIPFLNKNFSKIFDKNFFLFLLLVLSLIWLYFSYSRSSWIWFIGSIWIFALLALPPKKRIKTIIFGLVSVILLSLAVFNFWQDFVKRTLIREWSSSVHLEKSISAIKQIKDNPIWLWLWKAGPVTIRFSEWNKQNLAENWFLQMFQEFWILWGAIYLAFIISLLSLLIKKHKENFLIFGGFLGLLWLLIAWLFLHSFEDMPTSLILFLFLGLWMKGVKN